MVSILAFVHIFLCVFLVVLVLIQDPKGGAAGGMFGGSSSNSLFGATGAPTFMAKMTRWVAVLFASFCIIMTISVKPRSASVLDTVGVPASKKVEEAPAQEEMEPAAQPPAAQPTEPTPPPQ